MSGAAPSLLVRNMRLEGAGDTLWDAWLRDGRMSEIAPAGLPSAGEETIDAHGALALPGLRDAHCHVDNSFIGLPWQPHVAAGSLTERIARDYELRRRYGIPSVAAITPLLEQMIASGTSALRTHTKIDSDRGLDGVHAVAEAARLFAGRIEIEQVAFPQSGIVRDPGVEQLMADAVRSGVRVIGGIDPAGVDNDPVAHLNIVFGLATRYGCGIDIHLHDRGDLGAWQIGLICDRARDLEVAGGVSISHAYALGDIAGARLAELVDRLAESRVTVTTCIVGDQEPPPLKQLLSGGVQVRVGNDSIRNSWSPFGTGDMLERAWLLAMRTGMCADDELAAVYRIASGVGFTDDIAPAGERSPLALAVGNRADFFLIDAENVCDAIVRRPPRRAVMHGGVVVWRDQRTVP